MVRDEKTRRHAPGTRAHRVDLSLAQIESDVARRQARWREVRARQEREARSAMDDIDRSRGPSRVHIDFDELDRPFQIVTHPFATPQEEAARG